MGDVIGQASKKDLQIEADQKVKVESCEISVQADLLKINNDHYPTGIFQRRIVKLAGPKKREALALEEDMSVINLHSIESHEISTVAALKHPDRFKALNDVIEATNFWAVLEKALQTSGKNKQNFSIIIKPSLSFMYSLTYVSTYTDPRLIEYLIDRIYDKGYQNIALAEAHSTYAIFFTNRDIPTLAKCVGYHSKNYQIIDLTNGTVNHDYKRTLCIHEVHPAWRDANFRISFAKNKTHSYAFYTLAIKNIYGALPRENKFKEYHLCCELSKNKEMRIFDCFSSIKFKPGIDPWDMQDRKLEFKSMFSIQGNSNQSSLMPSVYYALLETDTHYFLLYTVYHAFDQKSPFGHEHDMEHIQVVVRKGQNEDCVEFVSTIAHHGFFYYVNETNPVRPHPPFLNTPDNGYIILHNKTHPVVHVQPGDGSVFSVFNEQIGHGIFGIGGVYIRRNAVKLESKVA